jgi:hypothetical protein
MEVAAVRRKTHNANDEPTPADARRRKPADVDWESPRWRSGDERQAETERGRRLRNSRAPDQPGAIDTRSIDSAAAGRVVDQPVPSSDGDIAGDRGRPD